MRSQKNIRPFITLSIVLLFLTFAGRIRAQNHPGFSLISSSPQHVVLRFNGEAFQFKNLTTSHGKAQIIVTKNGVSGLEKAAPSLPHYAVSLMLPEGAKMLVKVVSAHFFDKENILIAPSKGNVYRNVQPDTLPFVFGKVYKKDTFFPERLWNTRKPYVIRQKQGQTLVVYPFRYNPVKKILRVYDEIIFDVTFQKEAKEISTGNKNISGFENIFRQHFLNYPSGMKSVTAQHFSNPGMLIISYGPFIPFLKDFIDWKLKTGLQIQVVDVATLGDAAGIKACIRNTYLQSGIKYVLLVGDAPQVPSGTIAGNDSDNDYAYVDGNDHYPDLFVGRFSAESVEQLSVMLNRTMAYEKALSPDTSWYSNAVGIGSEMGPGYHDLMDYQQIRFIDSAYLLRTTYRQATELFDGSQGGNDADGDPTEEMLTAAINQGAGIVNYCGHGSTLGWNTSGFGISQVNKLENSGKWPFIISVSCATGDFVHQECFAESWLRTSQNENPTGAVAALMPTTDQSWEPPMSAQQHINALLTAPDSTHPPRTFAAICMEGCIKMNDEFGTDGYETTDTWTVFGDPSLAVRTTVPKEIHANYPNLLADTCSSFEIKTNLHDGRVTLSAGNVVYAVADVDSSGCAFLNFDSIPLEKQADLVITAFNYRPFWGKVSWEYVSDIKSNSENIFRLKVFPNPATDHISISFVLEKNCNVEVNLLDLNGTKAATLFTGKLPSGEHHFRWSAKKPGIYFLQIKTGEQNLEKKVVFLK